MKITRKLYKVGNKAVTERDLNAARKVLPDLEACEVTYSLEMSMEEFLERATEIEKEDEEEE